MAKNQTIQHKRSTLAGNKPSAAQIEIGELAINFADKSLYTQTAAGTIIELARDVTKSTSAPPSPLEGDMWYDLTNDTLELWDGTKWVNVAYSGKDVLPSNTTASPNYTSGSGTLASPYVFTVNTTPGSTVIVTRITVTNLNPNQFVPVIDTNSASNGGRFTVTNNFADATGTLVFNVVFTDSPTSSAGTNWSSIIRVGSATVYLSITATIASTFPQSVNAPTNTQAVTTSWTSANNTLTSTGDLRISLDGITFGTGPLAITTGATLYTKWTGGPGTGLGIDGAHGATITGAVVDSASGSTSYSLVIDKTPTAFTFTAATGAALSTAVDSNTVTLSGVNSYVYLTSANTMLASVAGGTPASVPASGTTMYAVSGQTLQVRQTSSATSATTTTVTITAGGTSASFAVTTITIGVDTPSITSPLSGSTGISSTATLTSSAYAVTGAVGTHLNSDWEIFTNSSMTGVAAFSSLASTTNKTTWTPTGLGYSTQYWARVRYRSNDGTAFVSDYSPVVTWTTASQPGVAWTFQPALRATTWGTGSNAIAAVWSASRSEYLVVGDAGRVATSSNGVAWTYQAGLRSSTWGTSANANAVAWSDNRLEYLAVGQSGRAATSPDGITWTRQTSLSTGTWASASGRSIVWNANRSEYLVVGETGKVATSSNGITWVYQSGLSSTTWGSVDTANSVVWSPNRLEYLVVGANGKVATSSDGVTWTYQAGLASTTWGAGVANAVLWNPNRLEYLVVGDAGRVATSSNGVAWTYQAGLISAVWPGSSPVLSVVWNGSQYLVVGDQAFAATSSDGITWTLQGGLRASTWGIGVDDARYVVWNGTNQYLVVGDLAKTATSP